MLRVAAALIVGDGIDALPGIDDQRSYHMLALRVIGGHGFTVSEDWWPLTRAGEPTAHWSYLYTLYLAFVYMMFGVSPLAARLIQALAVGILWPLLAFRIGRRVSGDAVGLVAAAWSAVYLYFVYYTAALMTEVFYITACLWAFDLALGLAAGRRGYGSWVLLGLALGTAALLRQLVLLFVPFLLVWVWIARLAPKWFSATDAVTDAATPLPAWHVQLVRLALSTALSLGIVACMILPWSLRNIQAFHRFVLLNTNAGFAFFWANHPIYGTEFKGILPPPLTYQSLIPPELSRLDEAALDSALLNRGLQFVLQDPGRYVLLSVSRIKTFFMFWPADDSGLLSNMTRMLSFGLALPFMLYGLLIALRRWRAWLLLYLFVVVYSGIHLLSWALIRYRLPVDAVLLVFAAYGLVDLLHRIRHSQAAVPALVKR
jgi:hypothetical protein